MKIRAIILLCLLCGLVHSASEPSVIDRAAVRAITKPSADRTLSFIQPGRIEAIHAQEGIVVNEGQEVACLDDRAEQAQLAQIEAQSKDRTQIMASEASLAQKKVDLKKLEKAALNKAATELEVEHARLDVTIAELSLAMATFEHEQAIRKFHESKIRVDNMRMKSPIQGSVEDVYVEAGESVNALQEVVRIVQTDPLWVDASMPVADIGRLKSGDPVTVTFSLPNPETLQGRVVHIGAVADAASATLKVRIEVPNPQKRPAGEHVRVLCTPAQ
jgi:RND family efflux transporter MFP subunit